MQLQSWPPSALTQDVAITLGPPYNGSFVLTISGPAQFLPVLQAGIDAKKADLQRQREAAAVEDVPDLTGEKAAPEDARPLLVHASAEASMVQADDADLDEQAPGWPTGTTLRAVQQAVAASCLSQDLGDDPSVLLPVAEASSPAPASGASAEAPEPQGITDA